MKYKKYLPLVLIKDISFSALWWTMPEELVSVLKPQDVEETPEQRTRTDVHVAQAISPSFHSKLPCVMI